MTRSISYVLREEALGPNRGRWLSAWLPPGLDCDDAFMFAYESMPNAYGFDFMSEHERRMFLLFCSYAAEDEE